MQASTRLVISPDLRDPFLVARRTPDASEAPIVHGDLRDPFAPHEGPPRESTPPADLRDPFERSRDTIPCATETSDGVKIQRPKAMRSERCPAPTSGRSLRGDRVALHRASGFTRSTGQ